MKLSRKGVINSNINNFCSPNKFANAHISRINPDKSTFLNSNLLVSNILNHLSPGQEPESAPLDDAYVNCQEEMQKNFFHEIEKKDRINRVHNLAKCKSQTILEGMQEREEEIKRQVDQITLMRIEMGDKARDIMSRKEDTAYLGRNLFLEGQKFLKQMKDCNPADKVNKLQATRMLMKERAKSKGRNQFYRQKLNGEQVSEISHNVSSNQINMSVNTSTLEASMDTYQKRRSSLAKDKSRDECVSRMIRNGSYQSVLECQKRHAAWEAFTDHWAQGFKKNDDIITTKKRRKGRKSPKQKFLDSDDNSHLDYNDKMSRHLALKKYRQTFDKTASSYQILSN